MCCIQNTVVSFKQEKINLSKIMYIIFFTSTVGGKGTYVNAFKVFVTVKNEYNLCNVDKTKEYTWERKRTHKRTENS